MTALTAVATVRAEWTKLRTGPGTLWLLVAVVVSTIGVSWLAAGTAACPAGCVVDPARLSLTGVQLGQAVVAILGVLTIGDEYGTGLIRTTLTAAPRRLGLLAAKAGVLTVALTVAAALAVLGSLLIGRLLLPGRGVTAPSIGDGPVLRAVVGSVLYLVLIGLLSLGVATVVRHSAAAIGIVLGLLYVLPILALGAADPRWQRHFRQVGPMPAGLAIQATTGLDKLPIGPWAGLGVLAGWAAAALLLGAVLLARRDA